MLNLIFLLSRCPASLWALSVLSFGGIVGCCLGGRAAALMMPSKCHASHLAAFRFPHRSHQTSLDVCLYSYQDKWMRFGKLYLLALPCLSLLHLLLDRAGLACCPCLCRSSFGRNASLTWWLFCSLFVVFPCECHLSRMCMLSFEISRHEFSSLRRKSLLSL